MDKGRGRRIHQAYNLGSELVKNSCKDLMKVLVDFSGHIRLMQTLARVEKDPIESALILNKTSTGIKASTCVGGSHNCTIKDWGEGERFILLHTHHRARDMKYDSEFSDMDIEVAMRKGFKFACLAFPDGNLYCIPLDKAHKYYNNIMKDFEREEHGKKLSKDYRFEYISFLKDMKRRSCKFKLPIIKEEKE